jgi:hypothetical protein
VIEPWDGYDRMTEELRHRTFLAFVAAAQDDARRREAWLLCAAVANHECLHKARKQRYSAVMVTVAQQTAEEVRSWSS